MYASSTSFDRAKLAKGRAHCQSCTVTSSHIGIAGASYYLPPAAPNLRELARNGLIAGDVAPLEAFGFSTARVAHGETHVDMAIRAARRVLEDTDTDPADVDLVLYAGALASSSVATIFGSA